LIYRFGGPPGHRLVTGCAAAPGKQRGQTMSINPTPRPNRSPIELALSTVGKVWKRLANLPRTPDDRGPRSMNG